jgi:hypothetical protein
MPQAVIDQFHRDMFVVTHAPEVKRVSFFEWWARFWKGR